MTQTLMIPSPKVTFQIPYGDTAYSLEVDILDAQRAINSINEATKDKADFAYAEAFRDWLKMTCKVDVPVSVADAVWDAATAEYYRQKKGQRDLLNSLLPTPA